MSGFRPAAWQVRRARVALDQWNEDRPDRPVPWEWVEEAVHSRRSWKEQESWAPGAGEQARLRHEEFARKLPPDLCAQIWP